ASGTFTLIAPQEEVKKPVQPVQEVKQPIKKAPSTTPVKQEKKVVKSHKVVDTSDSTDIELYVLLVILTGLGIVLLRRYRHV
ncbi:sortase B protein-sorting domain-containing protein, partial [Sharpea azabuensis]